MNEKTKNDTTGTILHRVNYSYIAPNGQIRSGSIAINAKSVQEAIEKAPELLTTFKLNNPKVTGARPY